MTTAQINGQQIFYVDHGAPRDGAPVMILSHGFLMDHEMFDAQVAAFSDRCRVITWDERGFGSTVHDGQPFSYWDSAADVIALMDALGIDRAILGGMSQGGFLSLRAALSAPARVSGLILIDTQAGVDDAETLAGYQGMVDMWMAVGPVPDLANGVAQIIIADQSHHDAWISKWQTLSREGLSDAAGALLERDDISDRLSEIRCPALVIHGTADTAITMERAEALAAGLSGAGPVAKIEGAAHAANLTHPEPVNIAISAFLAAHSF
jgi:pimeloyl-ACP methyl ester carboxylesterase